jgi:hypothetical protein
LLFLRHESASILLNASTLWITGGKNLDGTYLDHTELVSLQRNQSAIGPELPVPMAGHCVVYLGICTHGDPKVALLSPPPPPHLNYHTRSGPAESQNPTPPHRFWQIS